MYSHLVLGGTFDHFHVGHKHLLSKAISLSTHITIGLTTASLHGKKEFSQTIESFEIREKNIRQYIGSLSDVNLEIIPIDTIFGTTLTDASLDAILVTPQTRANAEVINTKRQELGLSVLAIKECTLLTDHSGQIISSTRIRNGEINRDGDVYENVFEHTLVFDDETKSKLRIPLGVFTSQFSPITDEFPIFLIGDVTTDTFLRHRHHFTAGYIDGISQRKPYNISVDTPYTVEITTLHNPAGTITPESYVHMKDIALHQTNYVYKIHGEEDLLACCAILLLPLHSVVVYGQAHPEQGLIYVPITESIKDTIYLFLARL